MLAQLALQVTLLAVLAAALIAYTRQYGGLVRAISVILGCGAGAALFVLTLGSIYDGFDWSFVVGFFELWEFAIVAGPGMILGGAGLLCFSGIVSVLRRWIGRRVPGSAH